MTSAAMPRAYLAVYEEAVQWAEQTPRAARDARQRRQPACRRLAAPHPLEAFGRERPPQLVDDARRVAGDVIRGAPEVLCPQAEPRRAHELRIVKDDVHLRVIEERVLVQVRGAERQPAVVDDADLPVDVDRLRPRR